MAKLINKFSEKEVVNEILNFVMLGNPSLKKQKIPLDKSLMELGYLDSFGIIELVTFLEKKFKVTIEDKEITKEIFGSINKMSKLVVKKIK
tara:strand:+ start:3844 stop:4116 length:273 start_codon:yes stop_codon:yes gene_type:complete